jgi:lipoyl-dependent peroxiredoxin
MIRKSSAIWNGTGKEGKGSLTSTSGVLNNTPYSFSTRFMSEDGKAGTNPEELIAAAHAGCFTMALSFALTGAGFPPTQLNTEAALRMEPAEGGGWEIKGSHLTVTAIVPKITAEQFQGAVEGAVKNCPVSKALKTIEITHEAKLV